MVSTKKKKDESDKIQDGSKYINLEPELDNSYYAEETKKDKKKVDKAYKEIISDLLGEDYLEEKFMPLSFAERLKRAQTMRRFATKIEMARERASKRKATPERLQSRAKKKAINIIRARILKNKAYGELTPSEKISLDKRLQNVPQGTINRIARKMLPVVRNAENTRLQNMFTHKSLSASATGFKSTNESINDLFETFLNESKRPHMLFHKSGSVKFDKRFKLYKEKLKNELAEFVVEIEECLKEFTNVERVQSAIQHEKTADTIKHQRMLDSAKLADKRKRQIISNNRKFVSENYIEQILSREEDHKKIKAALKDFHDRIKDKEYSSDKVYAIANQILKDHEMDDHINVKDLVNIYTRVKRAKEFHKHYNDFDTAD